MVRPLTEEDKVHTTWPKPTVILRWHSLQVWEWTDVVPTPNRLIGLLLDWAWNTGDRPALVGSPQWYGVDPNYEAAIDSRVKTNSWPSLERRLREHYSLEHR